VALGAEVIDLVRLHLAQDAGEIGGVGEVAVVQAESGVIAMWIDIEVIHPLGVEGRGAALDAVDLVAFVQQELGEIGTVLAGDASDEGAFGHENDL